MPWDHANHLCTYHEADPQTVASAIEGALAAKADWESLPWNDRAAIFLKAADLVSGKYRYKLIAATMLGQGKNVGLFTFSYYHKINADYRGVIDLAS